VLLTAGSVNYIAIFGDPTHMMTANISGTIYLAATTQEITDAGFEFKEAGTWYLCPGSEKVLGEAKPSNSQEKSFNYFNHLHLVTFQLKNPKYGGRHALEAIKIKCGSEKGWFLKRKADGKFRLTANPDKHLASTPTSDPGFKFTRVETMFSFIPWEWLTPEKWITGSGLAAIENRGV
jgi:hypothetical protein